MSCKRLFKVGALSLLCLGTIASTQVYAAGAANSNIAVSAIVEASCTIATTPLAFTAYSTAQKVDTTATVTVTCTNLAPYVLGIDKGLGTGSTTAIRVLTSASTESVLNYGLYSDSDHLVSWGNTAGTDTVAGTGDGTPKDVTIYGEIPAGQIASQVASDYKDTVAVTVSY